MMQRTLVVIAALTYGVPMSAHSVRFAGAAQSPAPAARSTDLPQGRLLTLSCQPPTGYSVYRFPGKPFEQHPDGYSGVRPKFIFDPSHGSELVVMWGNTTFAGDRRPEGAEKARVLFKSDDKIIAMTLEDHSMWTYELRPKDGIGFFTRHADSTTPALFPPRASVFVADCEAG